jgi:ribosomal protein S6
MVQEVESETAKRSKRETLLKTYEAMFIFASTMKDDVLEKALERIRGEITKANGTVTNSQTLGPRTFARPMKKREVGIYVKMTISMDPKDVGALTAKFRLNEEIFRVQILDEEKVKVDGAVPAKS